MTGQAYIAQIRMMKMSLKLFTLSAGLFFFVHVHAVDFDMKMIRDCQQLAETLEKQNTEFPEIKDSSITPLYTWRASVCETPPSGKGDVTALCDAQTVSGSSVFFWKKKNNHFFERNFLVCQ